MKHDGVVRPNVVCKYGTQSLRCCWRRRKVDSNVRNRVRESESIECARAKTKLLNHNRLLGKKRPPITVLQSNAVGEGVRPATRIDRVVPGWNDQGVRLPATNRGTKSDLKKNREEKDPIQGRKLILIRWKVYGNSQEGLQIFARHPTQRSAESECLLPFFQYCLGRLSSIA